MMKFKRYFQLSKVREKIPLKRLFKRGLGALCQMCVSRHASRPFSVSFAQLLPQDLVFAHSLLALLSFSALTQLQAFKFPPQMIQVLKSLRPARHLHLNDLRVAQTQHVHSSPPQISLSRPSPYLIL